MQRRPSGRVQAAIRASWQLRIYLATSTLRPLEVLTSPLDRTDICVFYWLYPGIRDTAVIAKGICLHRATFLEPTFSGWVLAKANFVFYSLLPQPVHFDYISTFVKANWLLQSENYCRATQLSVYTLGGETIIRIWRFESGSFCYLWYNGVLR